MGFITASSITNSFVTKSASTIASLQDITKRVSPYLPTSVTKSVATTLTGAQAGLSKINAVVTGLSSVEKQLTTQLTQNSGSDIQSVIKSITATFDPQTKSLANGITSLLPALFKDTNIKSAATTITRISDPFLTNFLKTKLPSTGGFKLTPAQAGLQPVSLAGASDSFGTGAGAMTGSELSTLLNRFNLDIATSLPTTIDADFSSNQIKTLFSPLTLSKVLDAAPISVTTGLDSAASVLSDYQNFLGRTGSLVDSLGDIDVSSYFQLDTYTSLLDQDYAPIDTNGIAVSANTANALVTILQATGCALLNNSYVSLSERASLFNLGLNLATQYGLKDIISALLDCSHASTPLGQNALISAFTTASRSDVNSAYDILGSITTPTYLNTDYVNESLLTNPNLTSVNQGTISSIFSSLGTTTTDVMSVPEISTSTYTVYDESLLSKMQPSFTNAVLGDSTLTDYFDSTPLSFQSDGSFTYT